MMAKGDLEAFKEEDLFRYSKAFSLLLENPVSLKIVAKGLGRI